MRKNFALIILLLLVEKGGGTLKCYKCHNVVSPFPDCENSRNWEEDPDRCSSQQGYPTRCAQMNGMLSVDYHQTHNEVKDVELDCLFFERDKVPENKCYHDEDALPWIMDNTPWSMMPSSIDVKSMNFHFKGSVCFCDTDWCNGDLPK